MGGKILRITLSSLQLLLLFIKHLFYLQCNASFLYPNLSMPQTFSVQETLISIFLSFFFPSNFDYNNKGEQPEMIIDLYFRLFSNNITAYPSRSWRWWLIDPSFMSMSLRMND